MTQILKLNQLEIEETEVIVQIKIEQQNQKKQTQVLKEVLVKKELKRTHLQNQEEITIDLLLKKANHLQMHQKIEEQTQVLKTTN